MTYWNIWWNDIMKFTQSQYTVYSPFGIRFKYETDGTNMIGTQNSVMHSTTTNMIGKFD